MAHAQRDPLECLFAETLEASDPFVALRKVAETLVGQGMPQSELLATFKTQLDRQANTSDETLYNAVADVMDLIVGWCGPESSLYKQSTGRGGAA
jgi:hypothetical protein